MPIVKYKVRLHRIHKQGALAGFICSLLAHILARVRMMLKRAGFNCARLNRPPPKLSHGVTHRFYRPSLSPYELPQLLPKMLPANDPALFRTRRAHKSVDTGAAATCDVI